MLDKGLISSTQLLFLLLMAEGTTSFLLVPALAVQGGGRDGWLSSLVVATVYGLLVAVICVNLARRFPELVLSEYLPRVLGRIPGKILVALYAMLFLHIGSVVLAEGAQFIRTAFLIETPLLILEITLITVAVYGAWLGIEVIARHNELVFPWVLFTIFLLLAMVARDIDFGNFLPVLENGFLPVVKGGLVPAAWRGELFIILMLFPYLNQKEKALPSSLIMVAMSGVLGMLIIGTAIGVFGDLIVTREVFPVHRLARYIWLGGIFERLELLVVIMWIAGIIIKLTLFLHGASIASANLLGLKGFQTVVFPAGLIILTISHVFYGSYLSIFRYISIYWPIVAGTAELALPALILLIAVLRKEGEDENAVQ